MKAERNPKRIGLLTLSSFAEAENRQLLKEFFWAAGPGTPGRGIAWVVLVGGVPGAPLIRAFCE
jgi:hypothetical protein